MNELDKNLADLRVQYQLGSLDENKVAKIPMLQFTTWFHEAMDAKIDEPNAFTLSTIENGRPHSRVVLLKGVSEGKLVFYTNYLSPKALQMDKNSHVSLNFLWLPLQRQIRIEGQVTKVSRQMSEAYFAKRPYGSQIGAIASPQGQVVPDRKFLEERFAATEAEYQSKTPTCPQHWGGYEVAADFFEFWQGRPNRLHDRVAYTLKQGEWIITRLAP